MLSGLVAALLRVRSGDAEKTQIGHHRRFPPITPEDWFVNSL